MRRALLISNPGAGQGSLKHRQQAIERFCGLMKARSVTLEVRTTSGPEDATRLAAEAARDGFREVIVSGGDGTINEALQGIVGTGIRLAVWPRGTANVLGRELRLPRRLEQLADIIAAGNVQRAYACCATLEKTGARRYFLLMAGIGLDAAVIDRVRPALKKRVGKAAFWYAGLGNLAQWRPQQFRIEVDGQEHSATFAALGKTPRYGGNLGITPRARLHQPEFEICLIDSVHRLRFLQLLPFAMFGGLPETMKGIKFFRASSARATGNALVQVDGELIGPLPMAFTVTPHVIEVVT